MPPLSTSDGATRKSISAVSSSISSVHDGQIQVTENGGQEWRKIEVGTMPNVPATAFVNDIKADLHDVNTVYVALDNHKYGDYNPYLMKSTDRGETWQSMISNLPEKTITWRIVQDHVKPELFFLATEFGIYFSIDAGNKWTLLSGGVPTISFRDLAIQKRENDLVGASFGRGFFVLDDYSALRSVSEAQLNQEATLFTPRKAWWYIQRAHIDMDTEKGSMGAQHYTAPNPDFGANFTYYLKDGLKSLKEARQATEKPLRKTGSDINFPGWNALAKETTNTSPKIGLVISDANGKVIRRINGKAGKGFHQINWDLRYPAPGFVTKEGTNTGFRGMMVTPGTYTATLYKEVDGIATNLSEPVSFKVEQMRKGTLTGSSLEDVNAFWREYEKASEKSAIVGFSIEDNLKKITAMQKALSLSEIKPGDLENNLNKVRSKIVELRSSFNGNPAKLSMGAKTKTTVGTRLFTLEIGVGASTYGPTATHQKTLLIVNNELGKMTEELN